MLEASECSKRLADRFRYDVMTAEVVNLWSWLRERWPYTMTVREFDERNERRRREEMGETTTDATDTTTDVTTGVTGVTAVVDDIELPDGMGEITPIRKIQPGDVLDVVRKLRSLMSMYETCSYTLYASFEPLGGVMLDKEAEKARHTLELATARVAALLTSIEKTTYYQDLRRETLAKRKNRASPARAGER